MKKWIMIFALIITINPIHDNNHCFVDYTINGDSYEHVTIDDALDNIDSAIENEMENEMDGDQN